MDLLSRSLDSNQLAGEKHQYNMADVLAAQEKQHLAYGFCFTLDRTGIRDPRQWFFAR